MKFQCLLSRYDSILQYMALAKQLKWQEGTMKHAQQNGVPAESICTSKLLFLLLLVVQWF